MDGRGGGNDRGADLTPGPFPGREGEWRREMGRWAPRVGTRDRGWALGLPGVYAEVAVGEGEVHAHAAGVVRGMERDA